MPDQKVLPTVEEIMAAVDEAAVLTEDMQNYGSKYYEKEETTRRIDKLLSKTAPLFNYGFVKNCLERAKEITYSYSFGQHIREAITRDWAAREIEHYKNWNEQKYSIGKKVSEYIIATGLAVNNWKVNHEQMSMFNKYFTDCKEYNPDLFLDARSYENIMGADFVIRFINALQTESKYTPGQFVLVKLGKMPGRVVDNLPAHARSYVTKNNSDNLVSPGIIIDVVADKVIEVKDKGRWYKVAISTPFSIFLIEERHIKKYAPTTDFVRGLIERSKTE